MRIAVIGGGIAGVSAALECLRLGVDVRLFEKAPAIGGHVVSEAVLFEQDPFPFELGVFMLDPVSIHPQVWREAKALGMHLRPIRLTVTHESPEIDLYWSSETNLPHALRLAPVLVRLLRRGRIRTNLRHLYDIARFQKTGDRIAGRPLYRGLTLRELEERGHFSPDFFVHWLYPNLLCWWGVPLALAPSCSADIIADSFHRVSCHPQYVFEEGWHEFLRRFARPLGARIETGTEALSLRRVDQGLYLETSRGTDRFDRVILAVPPQRALSLLPDPESEAAAHLRAIPSITTEIFFHTDASLLPRRERPALINYIRDERGDFITFWHGKLRKEPVPYFISWGEPLRQKPREETILRRLRMERTLPTPAYKEASSCLAALEGEEGIRFAGAHIDGIVRNGHMPVHSLWHENAFLSGKAAARSAVEHSDRRTLDV